MDSFKYLRVLLSNNLSLLPCGIKGKESIWAALQKIINPMATLMLILIHLYIFLICPHLEYTSPVWTPYLAKAIYCIECAEFACKIATQNLARIPRKYYLKLIYLVGTKFQRAVLFS